MRKAYAAAAIFTGTEWLPHHALVVNHGMIESMMPQSDVPPGMPVTGFGEGWIIPGYIDLQVYGAAGRLFSVYPDPATLRLMRETFLQKGTVLFLPTVATNTIEVFKACIDAVRQYREEGGKGVAGLHLEGPWLDPSRRGAHVAEWIHDPALVEVKELLEYGKGVIRMITLAPEHVADEMIDLIRSYGILISAGHSNADYATAWNSFKQIPAVTHLYNAMSPLHHRAPGLVGAAFEHRSVRASIIPDGYHVDYSAVSVAKKIMGQRLFAITDAVTETDKGPYRHQRNGDKYECNGVLSGSALSMHVAMENLVKHVQIDKGEAIRMCSLYPAELLNETGNWGRIAPGCSSLISVINPDLSFRQLITG